MAGRRTNLALLVLLAAALLTGTLAFAAGVRGDRLIVLAHGVVGFAILILTPWKSVIVRRGIRRVRPGRGAATALAVLVPVAVVFGILHSTGVFRAFGPLSAMQVHVGAALLAVPFLVRHVLSRPGRPRRTDLSRRNALRLGTVTTAATAAYVVTGGLTSALALPGSRRRFTGSYRTGSNGPADMPVTQWLADSVPSVDVDRWRLSVHDGPASRSWSYAELASWTDHARATIDCTGGWYAAQDWEGVRLDRLLPGDVRGRSVDVVSVTGYRRRLPLDQRDRLWLATRVGGVPLSEGHGAPLRLVVPGRRGFWWVKWVHRVEVRAEPWWLQPPFPLQ